MTNANGIMTMEMMLNTIINFDKKENKRTERIKIFVGNFNNSYYFYN